MLVRHATMFLQSGVPGFGYPRSDRHPNGRFVGPLLPYREPIQAPFAYAEKARKYKKNNCWWHGWSAYRVYRYYFLLGELAEVDWAERVAMASATSMGRSDSRMLAPS